MDFREANALRNHPDGPRGAPEAPLDCVDISLAIPKDIAMRLIQSPCKRSGSRGGDDSSCVVVSTRIPMMGQTRIEMDGISNIDRVTLPRDIEFAFFHYRHDLAVTLPGFVFDSSADVGLEIDSPDAGTISRNRRRQISSFARASIVDSGRSRERRTSTSLPVSTSASSSLGRRFKPLETLSNTAIVGTV